MVTSYFCKVMTNNDNDKLFFRKMNGNGNELFLWDNVANPV